MDPDILRLLACSAGPIGGETIGEGDRLEEVKKESKGKVKHETKAIWGKDKGCDHSKTEGE